MILEQLGVANIATQGVNRAVAAHVHHLEDRRATGGGRCQEARAQRVSRELRGIEPQPFGVFLHNVRHALIGQALAHIAVLVDAAKERARANASGSDPLLETFLIGVAALLVATGAAHAGGKG